MIHSLLVQGLSACVVALDDPGRRLSMLLGVFALLILAVDGGRFQGARLQGIFRVRGATLPAMTLTTAADGAAREPSPALDDPAHARPGRLIGLDVARGLALLGMVCVHITFESTAWWTTIAHGRASVLFITLAGLVVSMLHRRGSASAQPSYLRRRGAVLVVVGLLMFFAYWGGAILHYYGVLFLLAPVLLRRTTRCLAAIAAGAITLGPVAIVAVEPHLGWIDSLPEVSTVVARTAADMTVGLYPLTVWIGFFLVGVIVGRLDLARLRTALALAGIGVALATAATLISQALPWHPASSDVPAFSAPAEPSNPESVKGYLSLEDGSWFTAAPNQDGTWSKVEQLSAGKDGTADAAGPDWASLNDLTPHSDRTPWALQSLGIALAIIGLVLALPRAVLRLLRPIATVGSMTLTAYIVHPFLVVDLWEWSGAAENPERQVPMILGILAVLVVGAVAVRARWSQGPLEWLLKWMSGRPTGAIRHRESAAIMEDVPASSSLRTAP